MDFIKGFIPSNPLDEQKKDRMTAIANEVMAIFSRQYLTSTRDVILEEAETKVAKLEKKKAKWERKHTKREKKRAEHGLPSGNEVFDKDQALAKKTFDEVKKMCIGDLYSGMRCRRPRDKTKEKTRQNRKIHCGIIGRCMINADSDPYMSYLVAASLGCQESERNRRYTQFKLLNKAVSKQFRVGAPFPPANQVWWEESH